ncbi:MAG TPA: 50S ribosomal protein L17 [Aquifex aeolicus]|uniref:Large ribosomal subunit protein bL17 n=1 Tax=Aquifex aeolicus TaxID=63363 RepID=A0A9D0YPW1_AQUAO|nr:50S ribosomal protein L17 [Aquificales bacterium]HIP97774.1 50S ribosomal protein L17 [Aquifex aeolicus]HIQ26488.1 50S ribosomal protein L17 [Aquifex aeolicus]
MRHRVKKKHFDRTKEQRKALFRSLARALILEERIVTGVEKAKALRPFIERLITLARKAYNTEDRVKKLHYRRQALSLLPDKEAVSKLFEDLGPRFSDRNGGYVKIVKLPMPRKGDSAEMAVIEFVE